MAYAPHTNTDVQYARRAGRSLPLVLGGFWVHSGGHRVEYVERDPDETIWPEYPHRVYIGPRNETRVAKVLKTVAYIVVDEAADGSPVVEKWPISGHNQYDTSWVEKGRSP